MHIKTLIHAIKKIQLIVQQWSVLLSVCELVINPAFAQASKQFGANPPSQSPLQFANNIPISAALS